jgi:hypothetical protein
METHADDRRCSSGSFEEWTEEQLEAPQKRAAEEYDSFVALGNFPSMASYLVWSSWRDSTVEVGSESAPQVINLVHFVLGEEPAETGVRGCAQ